MTNPLILNPDTQTFDPEVARAGLRVAPGADAEWWARQARGSLHRDVLASEGVAVVVPNAIANRGSAAGGVYRRWTPDFNCGTVANDAVSGNCGTSAIETIWLDCGGA